MKNLIVSLVVTSLFLLNGAIAGATPAVLAFTTTTSPQFTNVLTVGTTVYADTLFSTYVSTDGGTTFSPFTANGLPAGSLLASVSGNYFYAVASVNSQYHLYISSDGGIDFVESTLGGQEEIPAVASTGSALYVATWQGLAYSTDAGTTWKWALSGIIENVFVSGNNVYAATSYQGLAISTNGGTSFTTYTTANGLASNTIWSVYASGNNIYAGTASGLSISTNSGTTFSSYTGASLGSAITNVSGSGNIVVASTRQYGVSVSLNNGVSFTNYNTANGLGNNYVYATSVSSSTIYAATQYGVSKSIDNGARFTNYIGNGLAGGYFYALAVSGSTIVGGTSGEGLSVSTNNGQSFVTNTISNSGIGSNRIYNVAMSGSLIAAGTDSGLAVSTNGGATFTNHRTGALGYGVAALAISGSTIYAANYCSAQLGCGTNTGIYISNNGGLSFTLTTISSGGKIVPINQIFVSGTDVYATSVSIGLFVSTNGGGSFSQVAAKFPLGTPTGGLYVDSANNIYVGEGSDIAISTNGGSSFTQYPVCPTQQGTTGITEAGSVLYVGCPWALFASDNGGASFVNVGSYPGIKGSILTAPVVSGYDIYLGTSYGIAEAQWARLIFKKPL